MSSECPAPPPSEELHHGRDYQDPAIFSPPAYQDVYPGPGPEGVPAVFNQRLFQWLHSTFSSGTFQGERFADICSGPTIHSTIIPSKYFQRIYLTEYSAPCRAFVQKWIDKGKDAHDWSVFFQHVANLEGGGIKPEDIEERVRRSLQAIIPCDLTKTDPLEEQWTKEMLPLDCIFSSLTLEAVANDKSTYRQILSKMAVYLRPGGGLILVGVNNQTFYTIGTKRFFSLYMEPKFVKAEVEGAGFDVVQIVAYGFDSKENVHMPSDATHYFFLSAIKK